MRFRMMAVVPMLASCSDRRGYVERDVPSLQLPVERVPTPLSRAGTPLIARAFINDGAGIRMATRIVTVGRLAIIGDQLTSPHVIVADVNTGAVVSRIGPHGSGEGQMLDAESLDVLGDTIYAMDSRSLRLSLITFAESGQAVLSSQVRLPTQVPYPTHQAWSVPSGVILSGPYADMGLAILDTVRRTLVRVRVALPYDSTSFATRGRRQLVNTRAAAVSPGSRRIVAAYQYAPRVDIYRADGRLQRTILGPRAAQAHFDEKQIDGKTRYANHSLMAYVDVAATETYIYALFCGCQPVSHFATRIDVFTWEGRYVGEHFLDRGVYRLAVFPGDSVLVAATWTPIPGVGVWHLPPPATAGQQSEPR